MKAWREEQENQYGECETSDAKAWTRHHTPRTNIWIIRKNRKHCLLSTGIGNYAASRRRNADLHPGSIKWHFSSVTWHFSNVTWRWVKDESFLQKSWHTHPSHLHELVNNCMQMSCCESKSFTLCFVHVRCMSSAKMLLSQHSIGMQDIRKCESMRI